MSFPRAPVETLAFTFPKRTHGLACNFETYLHPAEEQQAEEVAEDRRNGSSWAVTGTSLTLGRTCRDGRGLVRLCSNIKSYYEYPSIYSPPTVKKHVLFNSFNLIIVLVFLAGAILASYAAIKSIVLDLKTGTSGMSFSCTSPLEGFGFFKV